MASKECCGTIHMVASLDGFIARKDGVRRLAFHIAAEEVEIDEVS